MERFKLNNTTRLHPRISSFYLIFPYPTHYKRKLFTATGRWGEARRLCKPVCFAGWRFRSASFTSDCNLCCNSCSALRIWMLRGGGVLMDLFRFFTARTIVCVSTTPAFDSFSLSLVAVASVPLLLSACPPASSLSAGAFAPPLPAGDPHAPEE